MKLIRSYISFIILLQIVINSCLGENSTKVIRYKEESSCDIPIVRIPIENGTNVTEFTFCGKYALKYLKRTALVDIEGIKSFIKLFDFNKRFGFAEIFGSVLMFRWPNELILNPDQWFQICLAGTSNKALVRSNLSKKSTKCLELPSLPRLH